MHYKTSPGIIISKSLKMLVFFACYFGMSLFLTEGLISRGLLAEGSEQGMKPGIELLELKRDADYSDKGADTCLKCHDEDSKFPVLDIFKTPHAIKADKRTPFAQHQCETCHGPSGEHDKGRLRKDEKREPMIAFNSNSHVPVAERNEICSSCHQEINQSHWQGSIHDVSNVACSDCHSVHAVEDPMRSNIAQVESCGSCHQTHQLASKRFSTHPLKYGQMGCTSCHNLHKTDNEKMLNAETVNDTCFDCHAEKRGPFLWEHVPASEDCGLCHSSHGSNQTAMLTQRSPYLCQSCHSSYGHPTDAYDDSGLIDRRFPPLGLMKEAFLLGRACSNCHSKVHGSNHPSGSKLQR